MPFSDIALGRTFLGSLSAVVLACGKPPSAARSRWGRARLVDHVTAGLAKLVDDVVVVGRGERGATRKTAPARPAGSLRLVRDCREAGRPLTSLSAGLGACRHPAAFVCAADMPLIEPALVLRLAFAVPGYEAAVPRWEGRLQPLCAVYSRRVAGVLERLIEQGSQSLEELFEIVPTRFLLEDEVRAVDPKGRSFCGVWAVGARRDRRERWEPS